jgi:hypothetical protein
LIKRRHLELLGYILVSVPYWEWGGLSGIDERRKYLQGKLQCHVGVDSAAHSRQAAGRHRACTQAGGGVVGAAASGRGGASESVGLSESNALGLIKPDTEQANINTEQAKIDAHLEQQRRKAETSPSGGAAAGATAPATILIKSVWQKGPPAAVSQDAWEERSRAPTAFSEAVADTGKEGYRVSYVSDALARGLGYCKIQRETLRLIRLCRHQTTTFPFQMHTHPGSIESDCVHVHHRKVD